VCLYEEYSIGQITIAKEPRGCTKWRAVKSKVAKIMTGQLADFICFCVFFKNLLKYSIIV